MSARMDYDLLDMSQASFAGDWELWALGLLGGSAVITIAVLVIWFGLWLVARRIVRLFGAAYRPVIPRDAGFKPNAKRLDADGRLVDDAALSDRN